MTTIRVAPDAGDRVAAAVDMVGEQLWQASRDAASGVAPAVLSSLAGFGLGPAILLSTSEILVARLVEQTVRMRGEADVARQWTTQLLGSQVAATTPNEWASLLQGTRTVADAITKNVEAAGWWSKAARYSTHGTLLKNSGRWKFAGYADTKLTAGIGGVLGLAELFPMPATSYVSAIGKIGTSLIAIAHPKQIVDAFDGAPSQAITRLLGGTAGKVAGHLALPLAAVSVGFETHTLFHSDLREAQHGDAQGHSQTTRDFIFGAKAMDTVGNALLLAAPIPGVGEGAVIVGAGLIGTGALIRGAIAVSDMSRGNAFLRAGVAAPTSPPKGSTSS